MSWSVRGALALVGAGFLSATPLEAITAREHSLTDVAVSSWSDKYPDVKVNRDLLWGTLCAHCPVAVVPPGSRLGD